MLSSGYSERLCRCAYVALKVVQVVLMLKYRTMRVRGTEGIAPHIPNVGTTWNRLFSFMTRILYPRRKMMHWVVS